ncbi:MAG: lytic murein transglycosylase B, partial [Piscirickettsiaceae bacterium]|nr:lytic murein transglycosylase B [Piscirickettsiaceae bacterium]
MKQLLCAAALLSVFSTASYANKALPGLSDFIDEMHQEQQFEKAELQTVFEQVEVKESILKAISRPAEKSKPWFDYRKIFITDKRINGGATFWQANAVALAKAETEFGVPAEIIVAILGVETSYGGNVGSFRVVDALSTLAFRYPPRSKFFRSELGHFLALTREEGMPILSPVGSYAGAMGLGQFMPSSYRAYAVDFDGDGKRDIWTNPTDAIGSIANYLARHGWKRGEPIVHKTAVGDTIPVVLLEKGSKPAIDVAELKQAGVST